MSEVEESKRWMEMEAWLCVQCTARWEAKVKVGPGARVGTVVVDG